MNPSARSRNMSAIRRRDTRPEMIIRQHLHASGLRFRLDVSGLPGRPDVVLRRWNAALYVHGCYWHRHPGCRFSTMPATNLDFWTAKFDRNVERDRAALERIRGLGWRPAVIWECSLRRPTREAVLSDLTRWIRGSDQDYTTDDVAPPARRGRADEEAGS